MSKPTRKPKGLRLFDRHSANLNLEIKDDEEIPCPGTALVGNTNLDADQLDKLAERCKAWAKYLRAQKRVKPVPPKKWEDI